MLLDHGKEGEIEFTKSEHWMALLDYDPVKDEVYVSNPNKNAKDKETTGWVNIDVVLTSLDRYYLVGSKLKTSSTEQQCEFKEGDILSCSEDVTLYYLNRPHVVEYAGKSHGVGEKKMNDVELVWSMEQAWTWPGRVEYDPKTYVEGKSEKCYRSMLCNICVGSFK